MPSRAQRLIDEEGPGTTRCTQVTIPSKLDGSETKDIFENLLRVVRAERKQSQQRRKNHALDSMQAEEATVTRRFGADSGQLRLLRFIQAPSTQSALSVLFVLDVLFIFAELFIDAEYPACSYIRRDAISCCPANVTGPLLPTYPGRGLGAAGPAGPICKAGLQEFPEYSAGCDASKYEAISLLHEGLVFGSVFILSLFQMELLWLVYLIREVFFTNWMYILDLFFTTAALVLEVYLYYYLHWKALAEELHGVLVFSRLWRISRIGHNIYLSAANMAGSDDQLALMEKQLKHLMILMRGEVRESKSRRSSLKQQDVPELSRVRRQQLLLARGSQGSSGRASSRTGGAPTPTASREPSMSSEVSEGSCSNLGLLGTASISNSRVSSVEDLPAIVSANTDK